MLCIIFSSGHERTWHVGEPKVATEKACNEVKEVQADGDELEHIGNKFVNLPICVSTHDSPVQRWFGDHAKFIAANL